MQSIWISHTLHNCIASVRTHQVIQVTTGRLRRLDLTEYPISSNRYSRFLLGLILPQAVLKLQKFLERSIGTPQPTPYDYNHIVCKRILQKLTQRFRLAWSHRLVNKALNCLVLRAKPDARFVENAPGSKLAISPNSRCSGSCPSGFTLISQE